jgi:hypothetical protein
VGFVVEEMTLGQDFSEYFGFPCQLSFHRLLHIHHYLSSEAGKIGHQVASASPHPRQQKQKQQPTTSTLWFDFETITEQDISGKHIFRKTKGSFMSVHYIQLLR